MKKLLSILLLIVSFNAVAGPSDSALYQKQYLKWRMKVAWWMDNGAYLNNAKLSTRTSGDTVLTLNPLTQKIEKKVLVMTGGTVTNVAALTLGTAGTDLSSTVANSTTTPVITLNVPTASATNRGALSSTDWSYFNSKVDSTDLVSLFITCRNNTGSTILKGSTVYITGAIGQNPTIALARSNSETTSFNIGVAAFDIPNNTNVQNNVTTAGLITNINTSAFADGDKLYLSSTTAGGVQNTPPASPNFGIFIGYVLHSHITQGKILVALEKTLISQNTTVDNSLVAVPSNNVVKTNLDLKQDIITAGNGLIKGGSTLYIDSLKTTGQYGNSWQNGMYLGSSNNRSVVLRTNNLQRIRIDSCASGDITLKMHPSWFIINRQGHDVILGSGSGFNASIGSHSATQFGILSSGLVRIGVQTGGNVTIGGTTNISQLAIPVSPTGSSAYGLFSMSNTTTAFNGSTTGYFVGATAGTYQAINSVGSVAYNFLDFQKNGVSQVRIDSTGNVFTKNTSYVGQSADNGVTFGTLRLNGNSNIYIRNGGNLTVTASNILNTLGNITGTSSTTSFDNTVTWNTSGNPTAIKLNVTNTASGATSKLLDLQVGGFSLFNINKSGTAYFGSTYYVSGVNAYLGGYEVGAAGVVYWTAKSQISSPTDGIIKFTNTAQSSFDRLQLGGESSSFPSLQRAGNKVISRLADNSGNTNLQVKDTVYSSIWNGQIDVPTKNAVYDKIESLSSLYTYSAGRGLGLASNVFRLDTTQYYTWTNARTRWNAAPTASANYGLVSLGSGAFDGSTSGFYVGSTNGTLIAGNLASGSTSDLLNLQIAGVSKIRVTSGGDLTTSGAITSGVRFSVGSTNYNNGSINFNGSGQGSISFGSSTGFTFNIGQPTQTLGIQTTGSFAPTSGTTIFNSIQVDHTINQTGGANGITRGLYINPTLTAAADFRGIETNVASGTGRYAYYGAGTALALFGGNINFNGTAATDVMLRRNGTKVSARLGDNSADANVTVKDSVYDATAWDANNSVPTKNSVRDKIEAMNVTEGTWTPTLTNAGNVSATTARVCYYMRIGTRVMCWGTFAITPTVISTSTTVRMTLPISSTFTTIYQAGGSGIGAGTVNDQYTVNSSTSNPEVFFTTASSTNITSEEISFNFGYTIF